MGRVWGEYGASAFAVPDTWDLRALTARLRQRPRPRRLDWPPAWGPPVDRPPSEALDHSPPGCPPAEPGPNGDRRPGASPAL
jgi:hypothetical protein